MLYSQSAYYRCSNTNSIEIIECVEKTYTEYTWNTINRLFVTLQPVCNSALEHYGDTTYNLTHMNKEMLEREDTLPGQLELTDLAYAVARFNPNEDQEPESEESDDEAIGAFEGEYLLLLLLYWLSAC